MHRAVVFAEVCAFSMLFACDITHTIENNGGSIRENIDILQSGDAA